MADGQALVSVCIPLYNARPFIAATVESVLCQTYANWELIIVDDLSTDGSWEVVAAYQDPRIRCFRNAERLGAEGNWNRAISEAKGVYVKLLCHDDLLASTCLERQVAVFLVEASRGVSLVSCARDIINREGRVTMRRQWFRQDTLLDGGVAVCITVRAGTNLIGEPSATLFRAEVARRIGSFDGRRPYVIDLNYWVRILATGDFYYVAEPLCAFRISRQSWSARLAKQQSQQFVSLVVHLWRQGVCGVTGWDVISGSVLSWIKSYGRRIWFFLRA